MKKFIVVSFAGYTEDEFGNDMENLQVLDSCIKAESKEDAIAQAFEMYKSNFPTVDEYRAYELA